MTIQSLDTQFLLLINQSSANSLFDVLMPSLSNQGYLLALPFLILMIIGGRTKERSKGKSYLPAALWTIVVACCAVLLMLWAEDWIKGVFARERPCRAAIEGIRLITTCPKSYAMPSGHAMTSFAFAVPLFYLTRQYLTRTWRVYPLVLASLIAFSRVYLGVHYPGDVLVGALIGTLIALALSGGYRMMDSGNS